MSAVVELSKVFKAYVASMKACNCKEKSLYKKKNWVSLRVPKQNVDHFNNF